MIIINGYEEQRIPKKIKDEMILDAIGNNHGAICPCSINRLFYQCFSYYEYKGQKIACFSFNIIDSEIETKHTERIF